MNEERSKFLENSPYFKSRNILREINQKNEKDESLQQTIYFFLEMEERKGKSLDELKKDPTFSSTFEYLGESNEQLRALLKEASDEELQKGFYRSMQRLGYASRFSLLKSLIKDKRASEDIFLDISIRQFPLSMFQDSSFRLIFRQRERYRYSDKDKVLIPILSYLYPSRFVVTDNDEEALHSSIIIKDMSEKADGFYEELSSLCEKLNDTQYLVLLPDFHLHFSQEVIVPSYLDSLLKSRHVYAYLRSPNADRYNDSLILNHHSEEIKVVNMISLYGRNNADISLFDYIQENADTWPVSKLGSNPLDFIRYSHPLSFSDKEVKEYIPLNKIAEIRNGYTESFAYRSDEKGDSIGFIADRLRIDEHGGIFDIAGKTAWQNVNEKKYKASLVQDKDIYLTRKASTLKLGLYSERTLMHFAPRSIRKTVSQPKVYVFGTSLIIHTKPESNVPVYYLFAYLKYLHVNNGIPMKGKPNHKLTTVKLMGDIKVPILSQSRMETIASEFEEAYTSYLYDLGSRDRSVQRMVKVRDYFKKG